MSAQPTPAYQPYRDPTVGDIIIRTYDGVEFHVHRRRLSDASPIFADMFALGHEAAVADGEKPDVAVSEPSAVWEKLLPFCHLAEEPPITLDDIPLLLEAGKKYGMVAVTSRVGTHLFLPEFLDEKPFAVYALACMAGVPRAAALAARRTLAGPLYPEYAKEYGYVSGLALYNLLDFRRRCGIAAADVVTITNSNEVPAWMQSIVLPKTCGVDECYAARCTVYFHAIRAPSFVVRRSFMEYMKRLHDALKLRPDSSLASSTDMLSPVIASALGCKWCSSTIFEDTMCCAKVLESKIAEAIGKVELIVEA